MYVVWHKSLECVLGVVASLWKLIASNATLCRWGKKGKEVLVTFDGILTGFTGHIKCNCNVAAEGVVPICAHYPPSLGSVLLRHKLTGDIKKGIKN